MINEAKKVKVDTVLQNISNLLFKMSRGIEEEICIVEKKI